MEPTIRQRHKDLWDARHAAAEQWLQLPPYLAHKFCRTYDRDTVRKIGGVDEVLSHAYLAYTRARNKFDPARGFSFSTYATWAITNEFKNMLREYFQSQRIDSRSYSDLDIAEPVPEPGEEDYAAELADQREALKAALGRLPHKLHLVLYRRMWEGKCLREVADAMGLTKERVRQLEEQALQRLHHIMRGHKRVAWEDFTELFETCEV